MADDRGTSSLSGRSRVWVPLLVVVGTLLIQTAWSLALPPFRGTDEFDHAFRAASVAEGQWVSDWGQAENGRGVLVRAPRSLVLAASPVCSSYEYTGPDNCFPVKDLGHRDVQVASAATSYNPLFYWVVGTTARPFDGATALYVMRSVAALMCALMIGLAAWTLTLWARSWWPLVAMGVAFTPVAWFSIAIVAPNGLELSAALLLWTALLGLATERGRSAARPLLASAAAAGVVICLVRPLGPLWLALVAAVVAALVGPRQTWSVVRRHPRVVGWCVAAVFLSGLGALAWSRVVGGVPLGGHPQGISTFSGTLEQVPLWLLQGVAAFPRRGDPAPLAVYVLDGLAFLAFVTCAYVVARRTTRLVMLGCVAVALAVPFGLTLITIQTAGAIWQGRYGMPFHIGVALLAGVVLDAQADKLRRAPGALAAGWAAVAAANVVSVVAVGVNESAQSPLAGNTEWVAAPGWLLAVLVVAAFVAFAVAAGRWRQHRPPSRSEVPCMSASDASDTVTA